MGYKSGTVASCRFRQVRKQMESSFDSSASSGSGAEAATPTKGPKGNTNRVAKAVAKPRTPRKGAAQSMKKEPKGAKSAEVVTKQEDSSMEDYDMLDDEPQKGEEFDEEKFMREMDGEGDEIVGT